MCIQRRKAEQLGIEFKATFINIDEEEKLNFEEPSLSQSRGKNSGISHDGRETTYSPIVNSDE